MNKNILSSLIKRNVTLFFKDKGVFFTSLITPVILLVLYATFLGNVYKDSFTSGLPEGMTMSTDILGGLVGGQLISSILAVSCVTVSFCSNMISVQDKATGAARDFAVSPVRGETLALGYFFATLASSLIICYAGMGVCLAYVAFSGWYLAFTDVLFLALDVLLLVSFGTALSSVINLFLSTQGQISAVGSIISSGYGFLCGAYMPISQFSPTLQKILSFLPGTYGTSLVREHSMNGALDALKDDGLPDEFVEELRNVVDCNMYFFDEKVETETKLLILVATVVVLIAVYALLGRKKTK